MGKSGKRLILKVVQSDAFLTKISPAAFSFCQITKKLDPSPEFGELVASICVSEPTT